MKSASPTQEVSHIPDISESSVRYRKASVPADFTDLLGIGRERYCRYAWSKHINPGKDPAKPSAWQAIGSRQSGKPVTSLVQFKLASEGWVNPRNERICSLDVFVSPNQFFDWRNTRQLAQLHANWIDIDTINHEILSLEDQESIFQEVLSIIETESLPAPTGYVASGSGGMHLYWIYDGLPAYKWRVRIWREITLVLARTLKRKKLPQSLWTVDFSASRDPARVLRLPGTYHSKSGRVATAYLGGPTYEFDVLARHLVKSKLNLAALSSPHLDTNLRVLPASKSLKIGRQSPEAPPNDTRPTTNGRHTISQWWFRIYSVVCTQARAKGVPQGRRDLYAFILFVALRHIKHSTEEALEAIRSLNRQFIHLDEAELESYLKTAVLTRYKYSKESISEYLESNLDIDSSFLQTPHQPPLPGNEVRARQREAALKTAKSKTSDTLDALQEAYSALVRSGDPVTQAAVAKATGKSVRTVRRYWRQLSTAPRPLAVPLYIPAPGCVSSSVEVLEDSSLDMPEENGKFESFSHVVELADSKRSLGAKGASGKFSRVCSLFSSIPKIDKVTNPFSYALSGRLSRVILKEALTKTDSELVAISVASKSADPISIDWEDEEWVRYCFASARNMKREKLIRFNSLIDRFHEFIINKNFNLSEHEHSLFLDFIEMASIQRLDPISYMKTLRE